MEELEDNNVGLKVREKKVAPEVPGEIIMP